MLSTCYKRTYNRDSHSKIIYVLGRYTDGNFMCPWEILCSQVKIEIWMIQKVSRMSEQHEHHSLTFPKSFPISNTWHFEDDFTENEIMCPLNILYTGMCSFIKIMHPRHMGTANVIPCNIVYNWSDKWLLLVCRSVRTSCRCKNVTQPAHIRCENFTQAVWDSQEQWLRGWAVLHSQTESAEKWSW